MVMIQNIIHEGVKHTLTIAYMSCPLQEFPSFSMPESQTNFKLCPRDEIKSLPLIYEKDISTDLNQDSIIQEQLIWLVAKSKFATSGQV